MSVGDYVEVFTLAISFVLMLVLGSKYINDNDRCVEEEDDIKWL